MTAEAIAMEVLLVEICPLLQKRGQGVRRLSLICERVDRAAQSVSIVTAEPVNDPAYLLTLLKNCIAHIEPGFGIEAMRVHVTEAAPVLQMQHGLLAATSDHQAARYQPFLDHLHNKPGVRAVFRLVPAPLRHSGARAGMAGLPECHVTRWRGFSRFCAPPHPAAAPGRTHTPRNGRYDHHRQRHPATGCAAAQLPLARAHSSYPSR
ncbi:MAG: hypothetical protein AAYR33_08940 [Acetobacteraceae bacterium]